MLKQNFKNLSYQFIAQILPRAMMFVFILYLARLLGNTEYGKFEFAMSIGYLIGMFFELGGNMILTKHVARSFYSSIYYAIKIRLFSIIVTLAVFYAVLFLSGLYEDSRLYIVYASLGIAFSSMMNLYFAFFRGAMKMGYEAAALFIQKALFIGLALVLLYWNEDGSQAMLAFMISMAVGFIVIFRIFKKKEAGYIAIDKKQDIRFRHYLKDVATLALVEVFSNLYYRVNQVIIEYFHGFDEVSLYGVSYKIIEVCINFPSILLIVLFPAFARMAVENMEGFRLRFNKTLLMLIGAGFAAGVLCWFGGEFIFSLIGPSYSDAYIVLRYLAFSLIFFFPNFLITQGLIALNKNTTFAVILFAAMVLNIIISLILVPGMGAAGSAISIAVCELLIFAAGYYYIRKYTAA